MTKPMDDITFKGVVASRIRDAIDFVDSDLSDERERALRFRKGDISKELPSVAGRSKVVSRDVRDTIQAIKPSLLRIFTGNEKAVEFEPVGPEDEEAAKQATDYANFVLFKDNPGFMILYNKIDDALYQKTGISKVWWDESAKVTARRFENVDDATYQAHMAEEGVELIDHEMAEGDPDAMTGMPTSLHSYTLKRTSREGKVRIETMPPEELIIARDARSFERPTIIGHRCYKRVGELAAMGYDFDDMLELSGGEDDAYDMSAEAQARNPLNFSSADDESGDPAMRQVLYVEAYVLVDADGDGVIEMRKVCCAGTAHKVVMQEIVDDHPFAILCPDPRPHTAIGESIADCLDDIQLIRSQLLRLALDGLGQVITPRLLVDPSGRVDMKSVMDNRVGGVVIGAAGSVTPLVTDKGAPQAAMEGYRLMGEVRQERTGQNQASLGLEADALQSTSRVAASALVQAAQSRVEMIARIFAETGIKRLMQLILKNVTAYQDRERIIRLRKKWVPMDPRNWNPDMDVSINVGLGNGNAEEKLAFSQALLQVQQTIMQQSGPMNPWVNEAKVRNALEDFAEAGGKIAERYFMSTEEWQQVQQQMAQQPKEPPKPSPEELLAQIEQQKLQVRMQELQLQQQEMLLKDDRERDKNEGELVYKCVKDGVNPDAVVNIIRMARQATPSIVAGG